MRDAAVKTEYSDVELIVNQSVDGIIVIDHLGKVVYINPAAETLFDRPASTFIGMDFGIPVLPGESVEVTVYRRQHGHRIVELRATEINWHGRDGKLISLRDITDRKRMETEIKEREEEKTYMLENIADAVITIDEHNTITSANSAAARIFDYSKYELAGLHVSRLLADQDNQDWNDWLNRLRPGSTQPGALGAGNHSDRQFSGCRADGTVIELEVSASWIDIHKKRGYILAARDITARLEAERQLHIVSTAMEQSLASKVIVDRNGRIEYVNKRFKELTVAGDSAITGALAADVFAGMGEQGDLNHKLRLARADGGFYETCSYRDRNNDTLWFEQYITPIRTESTEITHYLITLEDVTQKMQLSHELEQQSTHDSLTGLLNRHGLEQGIESLASHNSADLRNHYVYLVNLDRFRVINDTCGQDAGDRLLRDCGRALARLLGNGTILARLDADSFVVVSERGSMGDGELAHQIINAVRGLEVVSESQDKYFNPTASVSYTNLSDWSRAGSFMMLIQRCLIGANIAKEFGGDQCYFVDDNDRNLLRYQEETRGVSLVNKALDQELFCLYYQPIRRIRGDPDQLSYEVLLRIRDGDETIAPAQFLPAAEKYKLGLRVDQWVINRALSWLADNPSHTEQVAHCGINISAESLATSSLIEFISEKLAIYAVPAEKICIEVTETAAVQNIEQANDHLRRLKELGCKVALDDFGTGMSSFSYLKHLDVDFLKIDGAFIRNIKDDPVDFAMVKAIKDVGKIMDIQTIAEFVEDDMTLSVLNLIGIDYAQGYGIGKPAFFC